MHFTWSLYRVFHVMNNKSLGRRTINIFLRGISFFASSARGSGTQTLCFRTLFVWFTRISSFGRTILIRPYAPMPLCPYWSTWRHSVILSHRTRSSWQIAKLPSVFIHSSTPSFSIPFFQHCNLCITLSALHANISHNINNIFFLVLQNKSYKTT